jgi:hypothetical protein
MLAKPSERTNRGERQGRDVPVTRLAQPQFVYRALLLAVVVEVISCAGVFGDSFSRPTAERLANLHLALNLPVYFLLYLLNVGPVLQIQHGCLRLNNLISLAVIMTQCCIWTCLFGALMQVGHRARLKLFHGSPPPA